MATRLHHETLTSGGPTPAAWLWALHGLFGAGRNWATIVRRVIEHRRDWGGVLIDLREHGRSTGMQEPHTLEATAGDLRAVEPPATAVLGHSFGGKVALRYAATFASSAPLRQVWVIDSTPSPRPAAGEAVRMIQLLRSLPDAFATREAAMAAMTSHGVAEPVAAWMATNLRREGDAWRWRFDLDVIERLLGEFLAADLWPIVENPPGGVELHFVKGTRSPLLDAEACERIEAAGAVTGRVYLHPIDAGHWVHVGNPDALVNLLASRLV